MEFPFDKEDRTNSGMRITHAGRTRWWVGVFAALLAGFGVYAGWILFGNGTRAAGQGPAIQPTVPVVAVAATQGDIHTYITGLGTVTALNTVTVHTRVDGQIMKVLFKEGEVVKNGSLLVEIDPRPFEAALLTAEGQLERDKALLAAAKLDLKRYEILAAQDSISLQQRDTQIYLMHQYEGAVKLDQGQVDNAKLQLAYARITAPITGRIGLRLVDPGNIVHATDTNGLAVITQEQPITVVFPIPEDSLQPVLAKLKASERLQVEAFDREQKRKIASGYLLTVDNQIDTTTGTVRLKALFSNKDSELFPNQFVNARLLLETRRGTTVVPSAAIQRSPKGTFVYILKEDNTVSVRGVKLGPSEGDRISIEEGLSTGERVVVDGAEKLKEGSSVEVQVRGSDSSGKGN
jgi:multidrug efflux system membrane fusion protein